MPQRQIVKCETSLDLLQHVDHHKFQQINNYRHTQTTMEGNGLERREISLICHIHVQESWKRRAHHGRQTSKTKYRYHRNRVHRSKTTMVNPIREEV